MSNLTAAQDHSHLRYRESGHEITNTKRQLRPDSVEKVAVLAAIDLRLSGPVGPFTLG